MGKLKKIAVLVVFTLVGLALAVFVFAPAGLTYLAEISKFAPTVGAALVVYAKSHDTHDEAGRAKAEASEARRKADSAEAQAFQGRNEAAKDRLVQREREDEAARNNGCSKRRCPRK